MKRKATSQAAWSLLMKGVTEARIEAHRLRHVLSRALTLVESSEHKEHLYQMAGDIIEAAPQRLDALESGLDATSYALSKVGQEFLKNRMSLSDRVIIDEATTPAKDVTPKPIKEASKRVRLARRVAQLHMKENGE